MYQKIVVTQGIVEVFSYEKLNVLGNGGDLQGEGENKEENYKETQRKRRSRIRQLICSNFDAGSKFVTLTFNNDQDHDIKDVKECNKEFDLFTHRIRRRYPNFKYVAVIEFQDKNGRGAVHYHTVCNLPYIKKKELAEIWGNGHVYINRIDHVDNVGAYVIKYMITDMDDRRLMGLKAYNCSKGLTAPVELKSWNIDDLDVIKGTLELLKKEMPSYVRAYESENAGNILYQQYNFNRKKNQ